MNGPTIRSDIAKAVPGKIDTFTDAHTGVAQQQEDVGRQVVATEQLLLDGLVLLRGQGAGQALGGGLGWLSGKYGATSEVSWAPA